MTIVRTSVDILGYILSDLCIYNCGVWSHTNLEIKIDVILFVLNVIKNKF